MNIFIPQKGFSVFREKLSGNISLDELNLIFLAYRLSEYAHRKQGRKTGEPFFDHPRSVALILMQDLHIYDKDILITALLHDVLEDSKHFSEYTLTFFFGEKITNYIKKLTKKVDVYKFKEERDAVYYSQVLSSDYPVVLIKLADRLDNMRDVHGLCMRAIHDFIKETKEIYIPLSKGVCDDFFFDRLNFEIKRSEAWLSFIP